MRKAQQKTICIRRKRDYKQATRHNNEQNQVQWVLPLQFECVVYYVQYTSKLISNSPKTVKTISGGAAPSRRSPDEEILARGEAHKQANKKYCQPTCKSLEFPLRKWVNEWLFANQAPRKKIPTVKWHRKANNDRKWKV